MTEPDDRFDEWLNRQPVEPLAPPPGQYDHIVRTARRRRWGRAGGTGLAVLAVVGGAAVVASMLAGPVTPGHQPSATGPTPSAGVTAVSPSPTVPPSPTVSPSPSQSPPATTASPTGTTRCHTGDLQASVRTTDNPSGHIGLSIVFTNVSTHSCTMFGYPGVSFLTGGGVQVNDPAQRSTGEGGSILVPLAPGAKAHADLLLVDTANFPPASCKPVTTATIRVFPPDETQDILIASNQLICSSKGTGLAQIYPVLAGD
jgi:hypothetical protein